MVTTIDNVKLAQIELEQILPNIMLFLDELREKPDFSITLSDYTNLVRLLNELVLHEGAMKNAEDVLNYITPILCKNKEQQTKIKIYFIEWIKNNNIEVQIPFSSEQENLNNDLMKLDKSTKNIAIFLSIVLFGLGIVFFYFNKDQLTLFPPRPIDPNHPSPPPPLPVYDTLNWVYWLLLLAIFTFLLINLLLTISAYTFLKRRFPKINEKFDFLNLPNPITEDSTDVRDLIQTATKLNRTVEKEEIIFDIANTAIATASNAGFIDIRYQQMQVIPEYLILIDKASAQDHLSNWVEQTISVLNGYSVRFEVFYFNRDVRSCYRQGRSGAYELSQLSKLFPSRILMIFTDGNCLLNPFSRQLEPWVTEQFQVWHRKVIFSPEDLNKEQIKYQIFFRNDFFVFPLSIDGLNSFVSTDSLSNPINLTNNQVSNFLPSMLYDNVVKWIDVEPPAQEILNNLIEELRDKYLGLNGFTWLCACAIYPEIRYELTIFLGKNVSKKESESPIYHPILLNRIMQLPWFRYAYMPDWLRKALIDELDFDKAEQIRTILYDWFFAALEAKGVSETLPLEIAVSNDSPVGKLRSRIFRVVTEKVEEDSLLKEYIFVGFMQENLAFKAPPLNDQKIKAQWSNKLINWFNSSNTIDLIIKNSGIAIFIGLCTWLIAIYIKNRPEDILYLLIGLISIFVLIWGYWILKNLRKLPKGVPHILAFEAAERFNYYGLRAILTTFMVSQFFAAQYAGQTDATQKAAAAANATTHDFVAMSYLLPLFGGMLAEWFWGKYKTILYLSMIYALGSIILTLTFDSYTGFTTALMLIAMGAGGIKPNVTTILGDQFTKKNNRHISRAYDAFYFSINAGSFISILLIPYLNIHYGPVVAFGVPTIAMLLSLIIFYSGRKNYVRETIKRDNNKIIIFLTAFISLVVSYIYWDKFQHAGTGPVIGFWLILVVIIALVFKKQWFAKPGNFIGINLYAISNGGFGSAALEYGEETIQGIKSVWRLFSIFAFIPVFWALWDQNQSEWVLQAQKMDLNFMGIKWKAEQISSANAILILLFIPLFSFGIYPGLKKIGVQVTPLRKFGTGLVLTTLSFVIISLIQERIDAGQTPNIAWQLLAYIILTAGEIMVSIIGLEYAYTQSPPSMKSTIMSCYLLMMTLGNVLVSMIQKNIEHGGFFAQFKGAGFFWLFTGICGVTSVLFMFVSSRIKEIPVEKY